MLKVPFWAAFRVCVCVRSKLMCCYYQKKVSGFVQCKMLCWMTRCHDCSSLRSMKMIVQFITALSIIIVWLAPAHGSREAKCECCLLFSVSPFHQLQNSNSFSDGNHNIMIDIIKSKASIQKSKVSNYIILYSFIVWTVNTTHDKEWPNPFIHLKDICIFIIFIPTCCYNLKN